MFRKITLDNFRSFDHIEFDLSDGKKKVPVSSAYLYGENGAGKTNLVESFVFLKDTIRTMHSSIVARQIRSMIDDERKLLEVVDKNGVRQMRYDLLSEFGDSITEVVRNVRTVDSDTGVSVRYEFFINGHDGIYEMRFDGDCRLVYESLSYIISNNAGRIFEFSDIDKEPMRDRSNRLMKNSAYENKLMSLVDQYWGNHSFLSILNEEYRQNNPKFMADNIGTELKSVLDFFNGFIVGMNSRYVSDNGKIRGSLERGIVPKSGESALAVYESALDDFFTRLYSDVKRVYYRREAKDDTVSYSLYFTKMIGGKRRDIDIRLESSGTRRLLRLFPLFLECARGNTVVIDELDMGIHDVLMKNLIEELRDSFKGQIIATTHNVSLLENMDPKNAFVIQIDSEGYKRLTSFRSVRRTQRNNNNKDRYLKGEFEGVPIISQLDFSDIVSQMGAGASDGM